MDQGNVQNVQHLQRSSRDVSTGFDGALYREAPPASEPATARFVPYHLWDNRAPGEMLVWMRGGKTGA